MATYANWVAKAASLLVDEHDLERGDVLLIDLPSHWLGPVFLGAAWTAGLAVAFPSSEAAQAAVVCGPAALATWAPRADDLPVLACSLLPMGVRFAEPLPTACTTSASRSGASRTPSRRTTRRKAPTSHSSMAR